MCNKPGLWIRNMTESGARELLLPMFTADIEYHPRGAQTYQREAEAIRDGISQQNRYAHVSVIVGSHNGKCFHTYDDSTQDDFKKQLENYARSAMNILYCSNAGYLGEFWFPEDWDLPEISAEHAAYKKGPDKPSKQMWRLKPIA